MTKVSVFTDGDVVYSGWTLVGGDADKVTIKGPKYAPERDVPRASIVRLYEWPKSDTP